MSTTTAFGPYKIEERIGSGGMGDVYRATDTRLEREVALKLVSETYLHDGSSPGTPHTGGQRSHERFLREARAAATLNHPNICAIYDTGEQDGRPYLVMELLTGSTLKQYLRQSGTEQALSPREVVTFSMQAASALSAAHKKGIVHRDIKPANLFVTTDDRGQHQIKVLDFGLAKKQGSEAIAESRVFDSDRTSDASAANILDLTSPGSTVGTVAYMSPEQAKGEPLDARTDLFSLGVVMYEMATGHVPFEGSSAAEVFAALLMKEPAPIAGVNPQVPAGLQPIISRLLAKKKEDRYAAAQDVLADLEALQETSRSSGSRASIPAAAAPAQAETMRKSSAGRIAAAVVLVLLIAAAGAWYFLHPHSGASKGGAASTAAPAPSAAAKDQIILADFINKTGDPIFDTTLNQALRVQLGQSPVIDIVSQQHLRQSLQYIGKKSDETITPAIAREIGEREGMKAILTGTIAPVGSSYLITLDAQNTANGDDIATTEATAKDKNSVLDALNQTATQMRAKLGESLASIEKLNTPFGQATTPSLEAFRAYALGDQAHEHGDDIPEAESHYRRALELDPNLAMAWARLGVIYLNAGEGTKAIEHFKKAYSLIGNVSERERLYISAHYYQQVEGNLDKAIETLQLATQEYPLQIDNFINLSVALLFDGQTEASMVPLRKALALAPSDSVALEDGIAGSLALDQYAEAEKYVARAKASGLKGISLLSFAAMLPAQARNDWSEMDRALNMVTGRPDGFVAGLILSRPFSNFGMFQKARNAAREGAAKAADAGAKDAQAVAILSEAGIGWELAECQDPREAAKTALELDKGENTRITAVATLASCGYAKDALEPLRQLLKDYPQDTALHGVTAPITNALAALQAGDARQALEYAEQSRRFDEFGWGPYVRGMAQMKLNNPAAAAQEFETATKYKGVAFLGQANAMPWPYFKLLAGRAYAAAGDKVNAKKSYDLFFENWKQADPGLKITDEARQEYAKLQ